MLVPDLVVASEGGNGQQIPALTKVSNSDARGIFQEAISHLMRVLAARNTQAKDSSRSSPKDFTAAHEPSLVLLSKMKELEEELIAGIAEARALGSTQVGDARKSLEEYHQVVCKAELHIKQIKAAHMT